MNTPCDHGPSVLAPGIQHVLEKPPTAENITYVNTWLDGRSTDTAFWRSLSASDATRLGKWVLCNRFVQISWALSAIACLAVTLCFSTRPLETFDRGPIAAVIFTLVLTALISFLVFSVLFVPLTRCWNFLLKVRPASSLSTKLARVYPGELDGFYKRIDHFPAACKYIQDVKRRRAIVQQDLVVAEALVPRDVLMAADGAVR